MKIGYARISTPTQNLQMQIECLLKEGCDPIFSEVVSGAKADRPEWKKCIDMLGEGDSLIVWAIDRMGRNLKEQIYAIDELHKRGVIIRSISQMVDSSTSHGRYHINQLAVMAQGERERMMERSRAGMEAARARGQHGGRNYKLPEKTRELVKAMYDSKKYSIKEICEMHKISQGTVYSYVAKTKDRK